MKKVTGVFLLMALCAFAACSNCNVCKYNADQDKAKHDAQKAFGDLDSQKTGATQAPQ